MEKLPQLVYDRFWFRIMQWRRIETHEVEQVMARNLGKRRTGRVEGYTLAGRHLVISYKDRGAYLEIGKVLAKGFAE